MSKKCVWERFPWAYNDALVGSREFWAGIYRRRTVCIYAAGGAWYAAVGAGKGQAIPGVNSLEEAKAWASHHVRWM